MKHTHPHRGRGFTLIELIIAISIMSLMVFLINTLFFQTQRAVSVGIQTGDMLMANETISSQIERDANAMVGPGSDGFLVIINKLYTNEDIRTRDGDSTAHVRSDQLLFFTEVTGGQLFASLTPEDTTTFQSSRTADKAKIWYGHVAKTEYDGVPSADSNHYANQWTLGRQAMLLIDSASVAAGSIYVDGLPTELQSVVNSSESTLNQAFMGITDVANRTLTNIVVDAPIAYPSDAINYAYPTQRLRVNPVPLLDGTALSLEEWRIAQTHAHLANNVSDFIVEFAGDYTAPVGIIDKDASGDIKWYGYWHNNSTELRRDPLAPGSTTDYDSSQPDVYIPVGLTYYDPAPGIANGDATFVFPDSDPTEWPYLIRIRYRMHDAEGRIVSANSARLTNGTIDDDNDGDINEEDEATVNGQWFEQIIKVNRP